MPELYQGKASDFEKTLLPGWTARLLRSDGYKDVEVLAVLSLPMYRHDIGALTGNSLANSISELKMPDGEFAQYRFKVMDAFEVEMTHPAGSQRLWRSQTQTHRLQPWDSTAPEIEQRFAWAASEFFVYQQDIPEFDLYPFQSSLIPSTQGYLAFQGYRYIFKSIETEGMVKIWVNGIPSGEAVG